MRKAIGILSLTIVLIALPALLYPARFGQGLSDGSPPPSAGQEENAPIRAAKWSMLEFPLVAESSYSNPYVDITVTARFTGPPGAAITKDIQGFWDGGQTYKVRFTPTVAGTWTYSINSIPNDRGLTRSGRINVSEASPVEHGFLRRDPGSPYSFVFDDGTHFFMMGQTYYDIVENVAGGGSWKEAVHNSKSYQFNKIRLLLYSWGPARSNRGRPFEDIIPYADGMTSYEPNRYSTGNHDRINVLFWRNLDTLVSYLKSEGMIADVILFSDGEYTYGTNTQNERYIRYALARLAAYTNVIWCMANEYDYIPKSTGGTEAAAEANGFADGDGFTAADAQLSFLGNALHANDPYLMSDSLPCAPRPISTHQHSQLAFLWYQLASTALASNWFTIASIQLHTFHPPNMANWASIYGDVNGNNGSIINRTHDIPIVNEEYSYIGNGDTRRIARNALWGIVIGGGYATFGGDLRPPSSPIFSGEWVDQRQFYGDIKVMMNFMTGLPYWRMTPMNDKVSSSPGNRVYALGTAGNYVVYVANGGGFRFRAPASSRCFVDRLNPRSANTAHLGTKSQSVSLNTPAGTLDYVYHLYGPACS